MRRRMIGTGIGLAVAALGLAVAIPAIADGGTSSEGSLAVGSAEDTRGQSDLGCDACSAEPGSGDLDALGAAGTADLLTWVEEEKVALDLYTAFAAQYDVRTFANIARAEEQHMAAVRALLTTYGLEDPSLGTEVGEFRSAELQALYDQLLADGSVSLDAALAVGRTVELDDIALLERTLGDVQAADVERVLEQQLTASRRHLAAFGG